MRILGLKVFRFSKPPLFARLLVEILGKCLGQAIRDRLGHDGVVVVMFRAERITQIFEAETGRNSKRTDVVGEFRSTGRDEVTEGEVGFAWFVLDLLAQEVQRLQDVGPRLICVENHVVTLGIGGEESVYTVRLYQLLFDNGVEQRIRFRENVLGLGPVLLVLEISGRRRGAPMYGRTVSNR